MEDIKVNVKLIIITICISFLIGAVIWCRYNIYVSLTKDENKGISYFEGDGTSNIESIGNKESDLINDDFFIQPNPEKKFKINNENPSQGLKGWATVTINHGEAEYSTQYSIPGSSEKLKGENIQAGVFDMSAWNEDGTYEEFIEDFIQTLKSQDSGFEINYSTRQLNIDGKQYTIVMRDSEYITGSYFCLAENGYACFLEIIVYKNYYDNSIENTINNIFSTFTII